MKPSVHTPILLEPILEFLLSGEAMRQQEHVYFLDATLGGGGHTAGLLKALDEIHKPYTLFATDQDQEAIQRAEHFLKPWIDKNQLVLFHQKFSHFKSPNPLTGMLADLGFSSDQIEDPKRGLSFQLDGPLDMRLDTSKGIPLQRKLNQVSQSTLEQVLRDFGEVRDYKRISQLILQNRSSLDTTRALAQLLEKTAPQTPTRRKIHPATKVFQALRIWVNNELEEVKALTSHLGSQLAPQGRLLVLTFHSLEDRVIKQADKQVFRALHKKPIEPSHEELKKNPRSRSAKLRVLERL